MATSSVPTATATFAAGVLVDLDHLDRLKGVKVTAKDLTLRPLRTVGVLIETAYWNHSKALLLLHSYELLLPLWAIALLLNTVPLALWISTAFVAHLLADQVAYRPHPLFFFLTFRGLRHFNEEGIVGHHGATPVYTAFLYAFIGAYLVMHIAVMTQYAPIPDQPEALSWFNVAQRFGPVLLLSLLIPSIQRLLNRLANIDVWTGLGWVAVSYCLLTYFTNAPERWFAWSTLGLLILIVIAVARAQSHLGNVSAWLLGGMVALLAIGGFEILYQTGLLFYYDFFDCGIMSYYVTIALQLTWIIPALIVILVLYQRGLRFRINRFTLTCLSISAIATVVWFANGMDIPLLFWQGHFIEVNETARPLMISISRASQGFWLLAVVSTFLPSRHYRCFQKAEAV